MTHKKIVLFLLYSMSYSLCAYQVLDPFCCCRRSEPRTEILQRYPIAKQELQKNSLSLVDLIENALIEGQNKDVTGDVILKQLAERFGTSRAIKRIVISAKNLKGNTNWSKVVKMQVKEQLKERSLVELLQIYKREYFTIIDIADSMNTRNIFDHGQITCKACIYKRLHLLLSEIRKIRSQNDARILELCKKQPVKKDHLAS